MIILTSFSSQSVFFCSSNEQSQMILVQLWPRNHEKSWIAVTQAARQSAVISDATIDDIRTSNQIWGLKMTEEIK